MVRVGVSEAFFPISTASEYNQEEAVDEDIEEEGRKIIARIIIAPEADLKRGNDAGVDEEQSVADHHGCAQFYVWPVTMAHNRSR